MEAARIAALLLTSPADVFYVTGFLTRFWESPARPWFLVLPVSGAPIAVIPAIGADLMRHTWVQDIRTWDAPDPKDDGVSLLSQTLADCVPATGKIGLPMALETHLRMPLADYARLQDQLAPRAFVDATDVIQRVREIKSEAEIDRIRATCQIAALAFELVPNFAASGTSLAQVFRAFQSTLLTQGADWVSYLAGGAGLGGYGDVISPADDRPLAPGDVLMLDTGAVKDGHFCDFDRNFSLGPPSDPVRRAHSALFEATELALDHLRPGMRACDAYALMTNSLRNAGQKELSGRMGHGLGLTLTEWPSLSPKDETLLQENMVLTLEPGVEIAPGKILVHEENIVLRASGPELLSPRAPENLTQLD